MSGGARVGLVVVSHSLALADAAVALALEMVSADPPPVAVAAGTPDGGTGTDATAVLDAVERVGGPAGVLVVMDLGSAVLSAELALELAGDLPYEVRLSAAPFVEGVVAAVVQAAAGAGLDEVAAEAGAAGGAKAAHLGPQEAPDGPPAGASRADDAPAADASVAHERDVTVVNPHGLHARPAAELALLGRGYDAEVRLTSRTSGRGPVSARSLVGVQSLGAVRGHVVTIAATGPDAAAALDAVVAAVEGGFGESTDGAVTGEGAATTDQDTAVPDRGTAVAERGARGSDQGTAVPRPPEPADGAVHGALHGTPAAPGRGWGPAWHLDDALPALPGRPDGDPAAERQRLEAAVGAAADDLRASLPPEVGTRGGGAGPARADRHDDDPYVAVVRAHLLLLEDDALLVPAREAILAGAPAATAWQQAVDAAADGLAALDDDYLAARAADVRAVGRAVRRRLQGVAHRLEARSGVLLARDLSPDEVRSLDPAVTTAVVTAAGSPTSHATLLARAAGLPLVVATGEAVLAVAAGTTVAVDGGTGQVLVAPDDSVAAAWRAEQDAAERRAEAARERARGPARTRDGVHVEVAGNAAGPQDAAVAAAHGADGIGLLRTELLFGGRAEPPDEDEQLAAYLAVAEAVAGQRVVVRTLDVGGDKPVAYADQPVEANPFLGLRGLRLQLERPDLLRPQLRAVVRAAQRTPLGVMFPMVTTVAELRRARAALADAATDLGLPGLPPGLEVGVMVEVPALALRTRHLRGLVDFVSLGTNDLTQYALAAERGNPHVAGLSDALDPAVLALVAATCDGAGPDVRVAVCGELAADPAAVPVLVGLGVRELSVGPRSVPAVKERVRGLDVTAAADLAGRCLALPDAAAVRDLLEREVPGG
ncbi:phosphoenolpyruvate--protein phosphotransferase [Aquipuribacter sp. SD81]|uniref:phosphoenolpyruvate--protein phosphotransferase n=1 Tax=Aquipuribacter sp. SD81 TaxID=3127703 RepID=UPI003018A153